MNCLYQTKRIFDLKEKMLSSKRYASIEQARIITRVYQENEKLSLPKKRAISLKAALEELEISVEDEFKACSDKFILMTDDGSYGQKGVVTAPLEEMIKAGEDYDLVITIGPLIMMKFVVKTTKPYNIPTTVSMNPIMIDGTGMCGGCRLTVDGQTKFACVDGPDFDGFKVDFDEAMKRGAMYKPFERHAYEETCNLFKKEVE